MFRMTNTYDRPHDPLGWHGTTILCVRRLGPDGQMQVAMAGDGQVSMGNTVMKPNARKVRRLGDGGRIPFGPYLAVGAMLWIFVGPQVLDFYLRR
jgi:ATP-dependent HslUV protease subunit HslV